jgi:hypothetical protein
MARFTAAENAKTLSTQAWQCTKNAGLATL